MSQPAVRLHDSALRFGPRTLWSNLSLDIEHGEFLAVLGPNGAGKSTLLRVLLGLQRPSAGSVEVLGHQPRRGDSAVGYIPQQRAFDPSLPLRGRDLVRLGLDGHRFGLPSSGRRTQARVMGALESVGATGYADAPVGLLSGGEQQRLRVAQALVGEPRLLLCDEPLLSLDLRHQQEVVALIAERRGRAGNAVVFVTHEINPILAHVDRVLVLVGGLWAIGTPDEVMTTETMSRLYRAPVDVLRVRGRVVVVGAPDGAAGHDEHSDFSAPLPRYER